MRISARTFVCFAGCWAIATPALGAPNSSPAPLAKPASATDDYLPAAEHQGTEPSGVTPYRAVARAPAHAGDFNAARDNAGLGRQRIEHTQPRSLPDALKEVQGVFVQETNRGAGVPILRGMLGPSNLALVDGLRWQTSTWRTGPNQYMALIDPLALRQINVVKGPSAVRYGNGAIGGVINAITHMPKDGRWTPGWHGIAILNGASADANLGASSYLSFGSKDVDVLVGGGARRFGDLTVGGGDVLQKSGYTAKNLRLALAWRFAHKMKLVVSSMYGQIRDATRT
ncbi:MAG TPA: hypothetical protein EYP98_21580, partial [Planctomycetes bacterium]|nr:hypothetical protein [Planctomycetota bacterium]